MGQSMCCNCCNCCQQCGSHNADSDLAENITSPSTAPPSTNKQEIVINNDEKRSLMQQNGSLNLGHPPTDQEIQQKSSSYGSDATSPHKSQNNEEHTTPHHDADNDMKNENNTINSMKTTVYKPDATTTPPQDIDNEIKKEENGIKPMDSSCTETTKSIQTMDKSEEKRKVENIDNNKVNNNALRIDDNPTNLEEQISNVPALPTIIPSSNTQRTHTEKLKNRYHDKLGKLGKVAMGLPGINKIADPLQITKSVSERRVLSKYLVKFTTAQNRADTVFKITSFNEAQRLSIPPINSSGSSHYISKNTKVEWSLDYYWDDADDPNQAFFWAIFMFKRHYRLSHGYFKILDYIEDDKENKENKNPNKDQCKPQRNKISSIHLKAFLYFVHHPKIRSYLTINDRQKWDQYDITIYIDGQKYTLQFFNGKDRNQCQALSILKHPSQITDDEKKEDDKKTDKKNKPKKIYALYFPKPNQAIEWRWYDTGDGSFIPYSNDELQNLEFEASYYANIQANFPISNPLFRSKLNTSIFDHCYLPRFSKLRSLQSEQQQRFCMRYTLCPIGDSGDYDVVMDQLRLKTQYARTVIRHFDRQKYLMNMMDHIKAQSLPRRVQSVGPMITSRSSSLQSPRKQTVAWIAAFDTAPSKDNRYKLTITAKFDKTKSNFYSKKKVQTPMGVDVNTINIKEAELITEQCEDYMWTRFKRKRNRHCNFVNGFWDISFNDDDKYKQLREHLDAILSTLQHKDILQHFKIDPKNGAFSCNDKNTDKDKNKDKDEEKDGQVLEITIIDDRDSKQMQKQYEYELLWYNTDARNIAATTHAIYIQQKIKHDKIMKMYIMYFPKPAQNIHWQWYDNNACKYMDYTEQNELLQLQCSYLSNLYENYPKYVIQRSSQRSVGYFSHCTFSTFMKNKSIGRNKLYVLRYSIVQEYNKCIVEQVGYQNGADFARSVRSITSEQIQKEALDQIVPRMDKYEYDPSTPITHGDIKVSKTSADADTSFPELTNIAEHPFEDIVDRFSEIFVKYQEWLCLSNLLKPPGILPILADIYDTKENETDAISKLRNDFGAFYRLLQQKDDPSEEMTKISDNINIKIATQFEHKSDKCLCVERTHRDRTIDDSKEKYFGFVAKQEIITQQLLDSYHCEFLHTFDVVTSHDAGIGSLVSFDSFYEGDEIIDDEKNSEDLGRLDTARSSNRTSSLILYKIINRNSIKFNTYTPYDTGYRYYYWKYYLYNTDEKILYQDNVADPGNKKEDGTYYMLKEWYIVPAAKDLKEEMLAFGDNFQCAFGTNQFDEQLSKAKVHATSEDVRKLKCTESNWEDKYGLKMKSPITINHLLAIQIYCSFTEAVGNFTATFRKIDIDETDKELKQRHSKCALWAKYLREFVEGFGLRLRKGVQGTPAVYYRGITKTFLFKKTILRFRGPLSTSVSPGVAENFARGGGGNKTGKKSDNGLVLTLKPHWGDYRGNIRALDCATYSDYPWEQEYLFIGGLEPLVIHNIKEITEINKSGEIYVYKIQSINNIHQIFEGMACKFEMRPKLIKKLIDNRLIDKNDITKDHEYVSQIFDFYCDDLREITIRLSLMARSYDKVRNIFLDKSNTLKLSKIIKLFPKCEKLTLCDGYDYQLIPPNTEYQHTILGVTEKCIKYVNNTKHPLNQIFLETNEEIKSKLLNNYQQKLIQIGWKCRPKVSEYNNSGSSEETEYKYRIDKK